MKPSKNEKVVAPKVHSFSVIHAEQFGIVAALLLHYFMYWHIINLRRGANYYDGLTWTYNTVRELTVYYPYLSAHQIRDAIQKLVECGVLVKGNYNKTPYDRTCWYALTDVGISICQNDNSIVFDSANGDALADKPIPNSNANKKANFLPLSSSSKKNQRNAWMNNYD